MPDKSHPVLVALEVDSRQASLEHIQALREFLDADFVNEELYVQCGLQVYRQDLADMRRFAEGSLPSHLTGQWMAIRANIDRLHRYPQRRKTQHGLSISHAELKLAITNRVTEHFGYRPPGEEEYKLLRDALT